MISFSLYNCVISIVVTVCSFYWIKEVHIIEKKILYLFIACFYFLFCGFTSFLFDCGNYITYYSIYTFFLGFTLCYSRDISFKVDFIRKEDFICFVEKYAKYYLVFYFVYQFLGLIYPENRLINLFVLRAPQARDALESSLEHTVGDSIGYLNTIFFYIALSAYIKKPWKIIFLMFFNMYLGYANSSYISRGGILRLFVVIFLFLYINLPHKRKLIIVLATILSFFSVIFFIGYMYLRMGGEFVIVDFSFAFQKIAEIELSFAANFDEVLKFSNDEFLRYLWWFISMPLPGFLKFGTADIAINQGYTENIMGMSSFDDNFYIMLPGLAIEGVYMFRGMYFFHAILYGMVVNLFYNTLFKSPVFYVYCIFNIINIPFVSIRGGTQMFYSTTNKLIIIVLIICFILFKIQKKPIK
ncbi:hypothetical protein [uncultured Bacteroides sp.]|uniref:hypothetical protein n=1 Tax=uncultured Bacteroides sp. TaxID=162156 RepID=UPI0026164A15|nr:hypothetical protein [uncultured Bacteroides sp.]